MDIVDTCEPAGTRCPRGPPWSNLTSTVDKPNKDLRIIISACPSENLLEGVGNSLRQKIAQEVYRPEGDLGLNVVQVQGSRRPRSSRDNSALLTLRSFTSKGFHNQSNETMRHFPIGPVCFHRCQTEMVHNL